MKTPLTPAGIEPATYRFVAYLLNHCATAVRVFNGTNMNITRMFLTMLNTVNGKNFNILYIYLFVCLCVYNSAKHCELLQI